MADASLELALDTSRMRREADMARATLQNLGAASDRAARSVDELGTRGERGFNRVAAFMQGGQLAAGSAQIAGGVRQVVDQFDRLGKFPIDALAGGLQGVSRTLTEIGRTSIDVQQTGAALGLASVQTRGLAGAFNVLRVSLIANPILGIATVIGLASSAIALFSSNAGTAADSIDAMAEATRGLKEQMAGLRGTESLQNFYRATGSPKFDQMTSMESRVEAIAQAYARANQPGAAAVRASDFADLLQQPPDVLPRQFVYQQQTGTRVDQVTLRNLAGEPYQRTQTVPVYEDFISPEGQRIAAMEYGRIYQNTINERNRVREAEPLSGRNVFTGEMWGGPGGVGQIDDQIDANFQRRMEERRHVAMEFGQVIGQGFADIGRNINSAGEALSRFLQQLSELAIQRLFIDNVASAFGSAFGSTGTQRASDIPTTGPVGGSWGTPLGAG